MQQESKIAYRGGGLVELGTSNCCFKAEFVNKLSELQQGKWNDQKKKENRKSNITKLNQAENLITNCPHFAKLKEEFKAKLRLEYCLERQLQLQLNYLK